MAKTEDIYEFLVQRGRPVTLPAAWQALGSDDASFFIPKRIARLPGYARVSVPAGGTARCRCRAAERCRPA